MGHVGTKGVARAQRYEQLVGEAAEVFGRRGYARTSLAQVAAGAGVSKAMVYHLFDSKEHLVLACLQDVGPRLVETIAAAQGASDLGLRAEATFTAIFTAMADNRHAWALIHDSGLPAGTPAAALAEDLRGQLNAMGTAGTRDVLVAAGLEDPQDHDLLDTIWEAVVAAAVRWWQDQEGVSAAEMAQRCTRLLSVVAGR